VVELLGIPLPGETIMGYVGYLTYQGKLNYAASVAVIYAGACVGITIAYFLGKALGHPFFLKYGYLIYLGPDKFKSAEKWFEKYGYRLIFIAYYIPGIRHINGYFSGIMGTPFHVFALPAYTGALLYAGIFVSLGRILGPHWDRYIHQIDTYIIMAVIMVIFGIIAYRVYRLRK
jgi:membrane protein DedA with SNARE-associated domain